MSIMSRRFNPVECYTKWMGVPESLAREAFRLAGAKLPVDTVFATRQLTSA